MPLKKQSFADNEIPIDDAAVVYQRGAYWHMRMWLTKERKYARFSLRTRNKDTALDKAKKQYHMLMAQQYAGKTYFSKTAKQGVEAYLSHRQKHVETKNITQGRLGTITTHLEHWLNYIGRDTKLKELERTDCENYMHSRLKTNKKVPVSQTTIENEQSSINALIKWLYKHNETLIDSFEFTRMKRVDRGDEALRRSIFTATEIANLIESIDEFIDEAKSDLGQQGNAVKAICAYFFGIAMISGLRRGEQIQLTWQDVYDMEHATAKTAKFELLHIVVRGDTSKVRKTRKFAIRDAQNYFWGLMRLAAKLQQLDKVKPYELQLKLGNKLMFSVDGKAPITARALGYHFDKLLERAKVDREGRDLVLYSFRHYFITERVNSNLPVADIAQMAGTSIAQIERTYYHTTAEKMISNALADYEYVNGILVPKVKGGIA